MVAASFCCCGDMFSEALRDAGVSLPGGAAPGRLADIPAYPGATFVIGADSNGKAQGTWESTGKKPGDVVDHYTAWMKQHGYKIDQELAQGETAMAIGLKGKEKMTVVATLSGEKMYIVVTLE
jgi:hypothetical protein